MTNKDNLQQELKEKIRPGIKASDLKKLKRSKSADDISSSTSATISLKKSQSQLEIPVNQTTPQQQITQLQETVKFHAQTSQNYLQSLQLAQAKITELEETKEKDKQKITNLEDQILQLRLEKIKDFGDYLEKENLLETELELNIDEGLQEIKKLENKLIATNKKKLELQQQLGQELRKILREEFIIPAQISSVQLARDINISSKIIREIVAEARDIDKDIAARLSLYFGTAPAF
nr:2853_t:CDS:2 [Entrophospora candida]